MDRIRPVVQHPTAHGTPCETTDDSQNCNVQSCNKNCVLHDWTEWSASCTKVCGGGRQSRYKHVKEHEYGEMGTCPNFHDALRFQWKACNTHECNWDDHVSILCEAPVDVVLALDGSGSLGDAGWEAMQMMSSGFTGAMGSGVKLGALVFDGPSDMVTTKQCQGWDLGANNAETPSYCGVRWAHHMTMDTAAVHDSLQAMESTKRGTLTNIAIDHASAEFGNHGREYAQSVLVIVTDSYPESKERAMKSAGKFKKTGRLVVAVVGPYKDDDYFKDLVSEPWQDNLVVVDDYKALTTRPTLDTILTDFCANIVQPPPPETSNY